MKAIITITRTDKWTVDIGDVPANLLRSLLEAHDGSFDGNWSPYDLGIEAVTTFDLIEVAEAGKPK